MRMWGRDQDRRTPVVARFGRRRVCAPLAWLAAMTAVAGLASGCGGSGLTPVQVTLDTPALQVQLGTRVELQVDLAGAPAGTAIAGYEIDLPEVVAGIDIVTAPCPPGVGTPSCQRWTIAPRADALPGRYDVDIRAGTTGLAVDAARLLLEVQPVPGSLTPPAVAVVADWPSAATALVYTDATGALWGAGPNGAGQVRPVYRGQNANSALPSAGQMQPLELPWPVRLWPGRQLRAPWPAGSATAALTDTGGLLTWGGLELLPTTEAGVGDAVALHGRGFSFATMDSQDRLWAPFGLRDWTSIDVRPLQVNGWQAIEADSSERGLFLLRRMGDRLSWLRPAATAGQAPQVLTPTAVDMPLRDVRAAACNGEKPDLFVAGLSPCAHVVLQGLFGEVYTFGANDAGQLGTGDTVDRPCRVDDCGLFQVPLPASAVAVAVGEGRSFALLADGTLWAWGAWGALVLPRPQRVDLGALPTGTRLATLGAGAATDDCAGAAGGRVWLVEPVNGELRARWLEGSGCALETGTLTLTVGSGGAVRVQPGDTLCRGRCTLAPPLGSTVTLQPMADEGYTVDRVGGSAGCAEGVLVIGQGQACDVHFAGDAAPAPTARFSMDINGNGSVLLLPAETPCQTRCDVTVAAGSTLSFVAQPAPGWQLEAYSSDEDCSDGAVTMDADRYCIATFMPSDVPVETEYLWLTIARAGAGATAGRVRMVDGFRVCPDDCRWPALPAGEDFGLVAESTDPAVRFVRFDGCDSVADVVAGSGAGDLCRVQLRADRVVTAVFEPR